MRERRKSEVVGHVYILRNRDTGRWKVGYSANLNSRFRAMADNTDCTIDLVATVAYSPPADAQFAEHRLLELCSAFQYKGEWFTSGVEPVLHAWLSSDHVAHRVDCRHAQWPWPENWCEAATRLAAVR